MDKQLIEAVDAFFRVSSDEELDLVLEKYPQFLTQKKKINDTFKFYIKKTKDNKELQEEIKRKYKDLQKIREEFNAKQNILKVITEIEAYHSNKKIEHLDTAINISKRLLKSPQFTIEEQLGLLSSQAIAYLERYRIKGELEDLNISISIYESAIANILIPPIILVEFLNNLAAGFIERYSYVGEIIDLQKSLEEYQKIIDEYSSDFSEYPIYPILLNNFGKVLLDRYLRLGNIEDLQKAIENFQQAIKKTPEKSLDLPARLSNLGEGLKNRYLYLGDVTDLQQTIKLHNQAITHIRDYLPNSLSLPACLNNLGDSLRTHYLRSENIEELQEAIECYQQAIDKTLPNSHDFIMYSSGLANCLMIYSLHARDPIRLQEAIEKYQQVISDSSVNNPLLSLYFHGLGICLSNRYLFLKNLPDLDESINNFQQAIAKVLEGSPDLPMYFNSLGNGLSNRYSRLGELADLQAGIAAFQQAVKLGEKHSVEEWLRSARNWLNWAFERNSWAEIEESYPALQKASNQLVEKQLLREYQESFLQYTQGIAVKVAYARIKTGQLAGAVESLEQGVARLLSSALARSDADLTQLQQDNPELYERYQQQLQAVNIAQRFYQNSPENLREKAQSDWQTAEKQFNELLTEFRQLQGYENFLLIATNINTVKYVSQQQPLIYVFGTEKGGYALNVFQGKIQAIALPELTEATLLEKINSYFQAYNELGENWFNAIDAMTAWLYQAIMQPMLQNIPQHSQITLIPIGALNLLPLHAASYLTSDNKRHYVLDDYTFNYAPNALSLQSARKRAKLPAQKLLAINEPRPVNANALPICTVEIQEIQKYFAQLDIFAHEDATRETVKNALNNNYSVIHFSCHGSAEIDNPLKTGLLMANNETLSVQDFLNAKLNARLVSLSACETGMIGAKHFEEVVGLPSSLLQAGVACVVSSLWSVDAYSTMFLMMKFYELFKKDNEKPTIALNKAQQWLRKATKNELLRLSESFPSITQGRIEQQLGEYFPFDKPYELGYYWAAFYVTGE